MKQLGYSISDGLVAALLADTSGIHERPVETGQPAALALGAGSFKGR
ncbi:hypothetical protein NZK32_03085 [Cyanobium sp. FGCU-52]|nr:hypothetical protein [Cyanobium sp. FGCU52]